ncbi:ABC transporter permease [Prevotella koreensis]|uniref:ABC transporter permease n=1 Tax=Prevotella koreensis TaxID=2490854 RepID=A0A432LMY2_9BACT|nr:ABC transporter permease [Prevotella koreensis]RUL60116.1 ABC transporter permease [Prevotella koreensis]
MYSKRNPFLRILSVARRECGIMMSTPIYLFCMVVFPIVSVIFFTSMMDDGLPQEMPIGIVDNDNTVTTRSIIRRLDAMQTNKVVGRYATPAEARAAMQRNEIYAFLYIPAGTTSDLMSQRRPKVSFYFNSTMLMAGALLYRDMRTVCTLASAAVGQATMRARGHTDDQILAFLQPISIDLHMIGNPWLNYNFYLGSFIIPGLLLLFVFLITAYSIGTELKFRRSKVLMRLSDNDIWVAMLGKMLPQTLIFLTIFYGYLIYIYGFLGFPHQGNWFTIALIGFLAVVASQSFGMFVFGLIPSLRLSMSVCSLWAMLGFTMCGAAFPLFAMHPMLEAFGQLFPLRHYYMFYQICVFNGYPMSDAWFNLIALIVFICLPIFVMKNLRRAMLEYVYIP